MNKIYNINNVNTLLEIAKLYIYFYISVGGKKHPLSLRCIKYQKKKKKITWYKPTHKYNSWIRDRKEEEAKAGSTKCHLL